MCQCFGVYVGGLLLNHGGKLNQIAAQYKIAKEQWLDLSTGISPFAYPVGQIPEGVWHHLPQYDPELIELAKNYYQADNLLITSGSQSIIQLLPSYRLQLGYKRSKVWLPKQGYKEHEKAWLDAGFTVCHYHSLPQLDDISKQDVVVVINPNNPTAELTSKLSLQQLQQRIHDNQGWLIVDEAFMDSVERSESIVDLCQSNSLFVLRSMGKFFGLAGMRVGFISASTSHLEQLQVLLGPWHVNGPACYVAKQALADQSWQQQQQVKLRAAAHKLNQLLFEHYNVRPQSTYLFQTVYLSNASQAYEQLCQHGVYVRLTDELDALRFGIPTEAQFEQLKAVLDKLSHTS